MIARSTMTPRMPQNSTRCCKWRGTAKKPKIVAMTNTLSIASDFSTTKPVQYSSAGCWPSCIQTKPPKATPIVM